MILFRGSGGCRCRKPPVPLKGELRLNSLIEFGRILKLKKNIVRYRVPPLLGGANLGKDKNEMAGVGLLNKEQKVEECDATGDAMKNRSWHHHLF
jgi:hypothetical protein